MPTILDEQARVVDTGTQFDGLDRFGRARPSAGAARTGRIVRRCARTTTVLDIPGAPVNRSNRDCPDAVVGRGRRSLAKRSGDAVRDGETTIHPQSMEPRWFGWVDDMHDWCISWQLWWGHRIPDLVDPTARWFPAPGGAAGRLHPGETDVARHVVLVGPGRSRRLAGPTAPLI